MAKIYKGATQVSSSQIYRELRTILSDKGNVTLEVWRGRPEEYKTDVIPENTFRNFEIYLFGRGWVPVDRPLWAGTLGITNPAQEELE